MVVIYDKEELRRNMKNELKGITKKIKLGCGEFVITVNSEDGEPIETFLRLGKSGSCTHCLLEGISRLIGLCLRANMSPREIADEFTGATCGNGVWIEGDYKKSCLDCLGKELLQLEKKEE
jgi:ribonucleoside-diphosphate reductase alpha chain